MYGETTPINITSTCVKNASIEARSGFVRKVYSLLIVQLMLSVAIATPICLQEPSWIESNSWLLGIPLVIMTSTMSMIMCCQEVMRKYPANYMILFVYTLGCSIMVGFASAAYTYQSVLLAAGIATGIFCGMTLYAWNTTTDFTGCGPYLLGAMLCLMLFGLTLSILSWCGLYVDPLLMVYDLCGVLLFTFFIIFDTQMILGEWGGHQNQFGIDDYVFATLNLYVDIVQLFLHALRFLGERQ